MTYLSLVSICISTLASIFFLKNIKFFAIRMNLIDHAKNKIHLTDTPKFGFFFSIVILINILIFFFFSNLEFNYLITSLYIFSFAYIGYLDDIYDLSVKKRFIFSFLISSIFFYLNKDDYYVSYSFNYYLNYFLLIFFTLGFIHLVNITDGINGLIPTLFLYSCIYYFFKGFSNLDIYFQVLMISSIFSILIFIIPNFLGICFLGNCGSYFISILISLFYMKLYSINLLEYSDILLIFYIPLIDGLRVTVTRVIEGKNPFKGDLSHLHHMVRNSKFLTLTYFILVLAPSLLNFSFYDFTIYISLIFLLIYFLFYFFIKNNIQLFN